ncbi:hypothetical protein RRG08_003907 [Elysia crispata]|uniref:Uncharacterized protein n=1 Tax=Elysia crispata TaxID=231223 RepID=A0AAE0YT61_9GAST|nr:hypothetical protein RRG08_003907 [Elysia crispata]
MENCREPRKTKENHKEPQGMVVGPALSNPTNFSPCPTKATARCEFPQDSRRGFPQDGRRGFPKDGRRGTYRTPISRLSTEIKMADVVHTVHRYRDYPRRSRWPTWYIPYIDIETIRGDQDGRRGTYRTSISRLSTEIKMADTKTILTAESSMTATSRSVALKSKFDSGETHSQHQQVGRSVRGETNTSRLEVLSEQVGRSVRGETNTSRLEVLTEVRPILNTSRLEVLSEVRPTPAGWKFCQK